MRRAKWTVARDEIRAARLFVALGAASFLFLGNYYLAIASVAGIIGTGLYSTARRRRERDSSNGAA